MDGSHELIFGGERYFGNNGEISLHRINFNSREVGSTEDRKLSWVSNLSFAGSVISKNTLGAENSSIEGIVNKGTVGGSSIGEWTFGRGSGRGGAILSTLDLNWMKGGVDGEVVGGLKMSFTGSTGVSTILNDGAKRLHLLVLRTFAKVDIFADKVGRYTLGGIDIELVMGIGGNKCGKGHDILGKSSGLIRADDGNASKSLYSGEGTDNSVVLSHVGCGPSIGKGNDGLKTLGNHSNTAHESGGNGFKPILSRCEEGNEEGDQGGSRNENGKKLGYLVNLLKYVCLLLLNLTYKPVNSSNLSVISGGDSDTDSRSLCDKGGRECHIETISKGNLFSIGSGGDVDGRDDLINGHSLSSKGGFSTSKVGGLNDTHIGRTTVSKREDDDISRDNVNGGDHNFPSTTNDTGVGGKHVLEGLCGLLGRSLLKDTNEGVDCNYGGNESDLHPGGEDGGCVTLVLGRDSLLEDGTRGRNKGYNN
mmetsp:Transcript_3554/g.5369  ORF Transcript_3554/g.5369 Transcript_3554/m.5369 type:complete len:478 (-) Transcript_3554:239-1672(-)